MQRTFITLAVRLVFQVDSNNGIVIFVVICKPCKCFQPVICGEAAGIPERCLMACGSGFRAVNIHHDLDTVLTAPCHCLIPDVKAVLGGTALDALYGQFGIGIGIDLDHRIRTFVLPLQKDLCGHRDTQKIETVVSNGVECPVHIQAPDTVEHLTSDVVAKPVTTRQPDLVAILVHDLVALDMKPVVLHIVGQTGFFVKERTAVCRRKRHCDGRTDCRGQHRAAQQYRRQFCSLFHTKAPSFQKAFISKSL